MLLQTEESAKLDLMFEIRPVHVVKRFVVIVVT